MLKRSQFKKRLTEIAIEVSNRKPTSTAEFRTHAVNLAIERELIVLPESRDDASPEHPVIAATITIARMLMSEHETLACSLVSDDFREEAWEHYEEQHKPRVHQGHD